MSAKRLLNKLKHPEEQKRLWFFNEKIDGYVGADPTEIPTLYTRARSFQQATVIGFGVVSSEGHIMTSQFFHRTLEPMQMQMPPWIESVAKGGRAYVFQQD
ncbi:hypothetical protein ACTXT7_014867 [Hymenolepis weldensis]